MDLALNTQSKPWQSWSIWGRFADGMGPSTQLIPENSGKSQKPRHLYAIRGKKIVGGRIENNRADSGGGSIVFISSMAAILGIPLVSAYTAAKIALVGLVRSLATVSVSIQPGAIEPDDIGHAAVYLCSPAAKFVSGCLLTVDGGAHIGF